MINKNNSDKLFNSLKKGLNEAIEFSEGKSNIKLNQNIVSVPKLPNYKGKEIKIFVLNFTLHNPYLPILWECQKKL